MVRGLFGSYQLISRTRFDEFMPKGLKATSSLITISTSQVESAANIFTQGQVDLQLNVLDREVFVVTSVDLNAGFPDGIAATNTSTRASVSTTSRTSVGSLADSNVLAVSSVSIRSGGFADAGVGFMQVSPETPQSAMDYIGIIATNDFFVQIIGDNNLAAKTVGVRIFGYRAQASADTFAALTQSELLSA